MVIIELGALIIVYLIPTLIADYREVRWPQYERLLPRLFWLNLGIGWTGIGYVYVLGLAIFKKRRKLEAELPVEKQL